AVQREHARAAAPLQAMEVAFGMADEAAQEHLEVGPEAAPLGLVAPERVLLEEPGEERLGQILGILVGFRPGDAEIRVDGLPVAGAERLQSPAVIRGSRIPEAPRESQGGLGEDLVAAPQRRIAA